MNEWIQTHRKAIAGALTTAVGLVGALVSAQFLPDSANDLVARVIVAITPILTLIGVTLSPANKPVE